jgi:hypothetical protein
MMIPAPKKGSAIAMTFLIIEVGLRGATFQGVGSVYNTD